MTFQYAGRATENAGDVIEELYVTVTEAESVIPAEYTVTFNETAANITNIKVEAGSTELKSGDLVDSGTSIKITATAASGYTPVITIGETTVANGGTYTVNSNTNIVISAQDANLVSAENLSYVLDADSSKDGSDDSTNAKVIKVFYSGDTKPTMNQIVNDIAAQLGIVAGDDTTGTVTATGATATFKDVNGFMTTYYKLGAYSTDVIQSYKGEINDTEVFVDKDTALSALSFGTNTGWTGATSGFEDDWTYVKASADTGLGTATQETSDDDADEALYYDQTVTFAADGFSIETGYVKVTDGAGQDTFAPAGVDYTVAAKGENDKGTGMKYTIGGTSGYVAYTGSIPAASMTDNVTLTTGYVKVTVTVVDSAEPTETYTIAPASGAGSSLTDAGETFAAADTANAITITSGGGATDLFIQTAGLTSNLDGTGDFDNDSGAQYQTTNENVTITIQNTRFGA